MIICRSLIAIVFAFVSVSLAQDKLLTLEDIFHPDPSKRVRFAGTPVGVRWAADGRSFRQMVNGRMMRVDAVTGRAVPYLDSGRLAAALQRSGMRSDEATAMANSQALQFNENEPGILCTVGLTSGEGCLEGTITGTVPLIMRSQAGVALNVPAGKKVLNFESSTDFTYYDQLESVLNASTGKLWLSTPPVPVPVQIARFALYVHALQDASSHATYCGDDAPSPPGGSDPGTYMYLKNANTVQVSFGSSCANSPHLASHVQETGTGDDPLPLRVYVALNNTLDELINFGNEVAKFQPGWIVNPELMPPDVTGGKNAQGFSAADLKALLVGKIVSGTEFSRAEVYQSGIVTLPLQQTSSLDRLHAMNAALASYGETVQKQSANPGRFTPLVHMPGNSGDPNDTKVCWQ